MALSSKGSFSTANGHFARQGKQQLSLSGEQV